MGGRSQPLTSCVIRFHFINGLMRDGCARATRHRPGGPRAPLRSSWVATRCIRADQGARPSCLDAERPGGYTVAAGASVDDPAPGGGGQRVVGVQVRSACRHLAADAESATRWIIHPRRLDPRAGPRSRRRPISRATPSPVFNPYGINALIAWLVIALAVAAFFVRPAARTTFLSAMVALSVLTEVVLSAIRLARRSCSRRRRSGSWSPCFPR